MKSERMHALETKARLSKILVDSEQFLNSLKKARKSEFEVSLSRDTSCDHLFLACRGKAPVFFTGKLPWSDKKWYVKYKNN